MVRQNHRLVNPNEVQVHLVGTGIATMATAVFLIRDAGVPGQNICFYEQMPIRGDHWMGRARRAWMAM